MDAGVPIKAPVAGIAMGLVYAEGKYTTLTDILGAEDAFGDMDFKVAGTADFVTALQLDTKIDGLPADVLAKALQQARPLGRLYDRWPRDLINGTDPIYTNSVINSPTSYIFVPHLPATVSFPSMAPIAHRRMVADHDDTKSPSRFSLMY